MSSKEVLNRQIQETQGVMARLLADTTNIGRAHNQLVTVVQQMVHMVNTMNDAVIILKKKGLINDDDIREIRSPKPESPEPNVQPAQAQPEGVEAQSADRGAKQIVLS